MAQMDRTSGIAKMDGVSHDILGKHTKFLPFNGLL